MKKTWNVVSDILGYDKKSGAITERVINDVPCDERVSIVNHEIEYFTNTGSNLSGSFTDSTLYLPYFAEAINETFSFEAVT